MTYSKLIMLSGEAGAGKDSVANLLVEKHDWLKYSIAGPIRRFAQDMFGFTDEQVYGMSSAKNDPDPRWTRPCTPCKGSGLVRSAIRFHECTACMGVGSINDNSPRRVMQLLGEEYLRQMIHPDALTIRARPELEKLLINVHNGNVAGIVIIDARNDNDRNNLHDWLNGARVHVAAPTRSAKRDRKKESWRSHSSENRQPKQGEYDYLVENDEEWPFPALNAKVDIMLMELFGT